MKETNLSNVITASKSSNDIQYDQNAKNLLANRQIFAWILKHTLSEFESMSIREIMDSIGSIWTKPVAPGLTNVSDNWKAFPLEDVVQNEGEIYFDLWSEVFCKNTNYKIIVNIEAQRDDDPKRLKYHIENRGTYYLARLVSAQNESVFEHQDYDKLEKVKSIWLCMNCKSDSIVKYNFTPEVVYGDYFGDMPQGQMEMIIVRLRGEKGVEKSNNILISMLEDVFRRGESLEEKKENLEQYEDIDITEEFESEVTDMCDLSSVIKEEGIQEGLQIGIQQGHHEGVQEGKIMGMILADCTNKEIMKKTGESEKTIEAIREEMDNNK